MPLSPIAYMEWLNKKTEFQTEDIDLLQFCPQQLQSFPIETIRLWRNQDTTLELKNDVHCSEAKFREWVDSNRELSSGIFEPGISLVMYPRLSGLHPETRTAMGTLSLPCNKETFSYAAKRMFQHRSLSQVVKGNSTAIIHSRSITWQNHGTSNVYHCRSDTASPTDADDIVLSVTSFKDVPIVCATIYGCTPKIRKWIKVFLTQIKTSKQALHPLLLPMFFVEFERKRLFNLLERNKTKLNQRIIEMESKLRGEAPSADEKRNADNAARVKDCESTKLWITVSSLKNGLESLRIQIRNLLDHSKDVSRTLFQPQSDQADIYAEQRHTAELIEGRLREMLVEFDSKIRNYESVLGGMSMATQMEWNYYARRDTRANIIIANATKKDSSQMKSISLLGMIFLPGTFLATLFSMEFFNWNPSGNNQIISPWIGLYVGFTVILTGFTIWRWKKWTTEEEKHALVQLKRDLDSEEDSIV